MNAPTPFRTQRFVLGMLWLLWVTVIAGCGGDVGSGGTGAEPPAVSGGTVTGFGSVIIDGLRFDDRTVATVAETAPGSEVPAEARMGHRVELELDADGKAKALRVESSVTGQVTTTSVTGPQAGSFVMLGQTVTVNADVAVGPVTQFGGGYTNALGVQVGDVVEVHGAAKGSGGSQVLQATRVEKQSMLPAYLRVGGVVSAFGVGGPNRFALGSLTIDYGAASITPAGALLVNGVSVLVFAPAANLSTPLVGGPVLAASALRVKSLRNTGRETYASGFVALLGAVPGQFELSGLIVKYSPSAVTPAGTVLADGQYVQARGRFAADGSLVATQVKLRDGKSEPEAELKGTIVGFSSASGTFRIRDVTVTLAAAKLEGCPATGLNDGLFVELEGSLNANGVTAKKVECKDEPASAVIERNGLAGAVDRPATRFTLSASGKPPVQVRWTATTFFRGVTPATLNGKTVEVEGTIVNGDIEATKIKVDD